MIRIENLKKSYGKTVVLQGVDATFENGKIHGLLGLNGAGKSTLLRLLSGVYEPEGGIIWIDNKDLAGNTKLKEKIFFLSDDPYYNTNATIKDLENLYASFYSSFSTLELEKNLLLLQITSKEPLSSFSKGMRRKAYIALAFASGAEILLMDEVFDGLDPTSRMEFKKLLASFISENPERLVIVASHSLRELEDIADHFVLLKDGRVETSSLSSNDSPLKKVQLAFDHEVDLSLFKDPRISRLVPDGRFLTLYIACPDEDELNGYLQQFHPLFSQIKDASLEEQFVEMTEEKQ